MEDNMRKEEELLKDAENAVSLSDEELDEASGGAKSSGAIPMGIKPPLGIKAPDGIKTPNKVSGTKSPM